MIKRCLVVRGQSHPGPLLYHATTSDKARAIQMVGLRVGPRTKRSTGYCAKYDWDCNRAEAYESSEKLLEDVRSNERLDLPSRRGAVFFSQEGTSVHTDPDIWKVGKDDWGMPKYDFGFGRDTLFIIDPTRIPCQCGVGNQDNSDWVFQMFLDRLRGDAHYTMDKMLDSARWFWRRTKSFDPNKAYDYADGTPEIWCPCTIPREAIVDKIGGKPHEY